MSQDLGWHIVKNFKKSLDHQCNFSVTKYLHFAEGVAWRNNVEKQRFKSSKNLSSFDSYIFLWQTALSCKNPCSTFVILTARFMKSPYRVCLCTLCCSSCFLSISWACCSFSLLISASFSSPFSLSLSAFSMTWRLWSFCTDGNRR